MGKYSRVIDRLQRGPGVEPSYQERVEEVKASLARADSGFKLTSPVLAREYADLRAEKDGIERELSECQLRLEAISQLMTEHFEADGVTSMRVGDSSISVYQEPYAQVADKEEFRLWCLKQGLEKQMHLQWQTTNSIVKARLLNGDAEPPGITCWAKTVIKLRKEGE